MIEAYKKKYGATKRSLSQAAALVVEFS